VWTASSAPSACRSPVCAPPPAGVKREGPCLDTYVHVMAEQRGAEPISAEEQIALARSQLASGRPEDAQLSFDAL